MEYYSEVAFELVKSKYNDLKGNNYFFDDSVEKKELFDILKRENDKANDKFVILFVSKTFAEILIVDFMRLNNMEFNYSDYKNIS